MHVDGASGAFLAPFVAPEVQFDFRIPRVKSISTSGHKFGLAPLGVGWVIWRDKAELPEELIFHVTYLGGDMPDFQINFSRPAGQIIAQYYDFIRLGKEGYARIHEACYYTGAYLADEIPKLGPFELLCESTPATGIPAVTWRMKEGADPGYTLYDLADRLRVRGWQVPAYPLTGTVSDVVVQRILVRQGLDYDLASILLLADFKASVSPLRQAPGERDHVARGGRGLQPPVGPTGGRRRRWSPGPDHQRDPSQRRLCFVFARARSDRRSGPCGDRPSRADRLPPGDSDPGDLPNNAKGFTECSLPPTRCSTSSGSCWSSSCSSSGSGC